MTYSEIEMKILNYYSDKLDVSKDSLVVSIGSFTEYEFDILKKLMNEYRNIENDSEIILSSEKLISDGGQIDGIINALGSLTDKCIRVQSNEKILQETLASFINKYSFHKGSFSIALSNVAKSISREF